MSGPQAESLGDFDVVAVGGGPGGWAAAVAASRRGASVLLIEREGCLGGAATTMLVCPFMQHRTWPLPDTGVRRVVNAGLFREVCEAVAPGAFETEHCVGFEDEAIKVVFDRLAGDAGVQVLFHAALYDAETADGRVTAVRLAHNSGPLRVTGRVFVDGTGDGLLAARAGAETWMGDEAGAVMPMTLMFVVAGVETDRVPQDKAFKALCAVGAGDTPALWNTNYSCQFIKARGRLHVNAIRVTGSTLDPMSLSRAEAEGRRRVENFVAWMREKVPGCENAYLEKAGAHIGIRESRRVVGDYVLTYEDWKRHARFDDAVACCCYAVDVHGQQQGQTRVERMPPGQYYQIPYRCLTPRGLVNLLVASRSISADPVAHSSLRVMPSVMAVGQAAGTAAAMALPGGDVRSVPVEALQAALREAGAVIEA